MRVRHLLTAILAISISRSVAAETITLSARPGEFDVKTLGTAAANTRVSASVRIVKFHGTAAWPPAAYIGFYEGPNRNRSVQFLIIRNRESDSYLVAGYRIIEDGRETRVESLENPALDARPRIHLTFDKGVVSLRLNEGVSHTIRTSLRVVAPYIAVSSSTGEFTIEP